MMYQNCNVLALLLVAFVAACISGADGATALFIPSSAPHSKKKSYNLINRGVISAAKAMNSVAFLSELVALKDTSDVSYFQSSYQEPSVANISRGGGGSFVCQKRKEHKHILRLVANAVRSGTVQLYATSGHADVNHNGSRVDCKTSQDATIAVSDTSSRSTTTEYIGNLWFMGNKGIRFRETVRVSEISSDGKTATVECITKYRTKGQWNDCSKVACTLSAVDRGINMVTESEILVSLPLPGLAERAIRSKISHAFESAAQAFFGVEGDVGAPIIS